MKLRQIALAAGLLSGFLASGQALAVNVCTACQYVLGGPTFLGSLNPNTFDIAQYNRSDLNNTAAAPIPVTDYWLFNLSPAGSWQISGSITPFGNPQYIQNLSVALFNISGYTVAPSAPGTGAQVTSFGLGTQVIPATISEAGGTFAGLNTTLAAGDYAFRVTYNLTQAQVGEVSSYNGQISTRRIPEPGTLALVGLALVGGAFAARRTRKA